MNRRVVLIIGVVIVLIVILGVLFFPAALNAPTRLPSSTPVAALLTATPDSGQGSGPELEPTPLPTRQGVLPDDPTPFPTPRIAPTRLPPSNLQPTNAVQTAIVNTLIAQENIIAQTRTPVIVETISFDERRTPIAIIDQFGKRVGSGELIIRAPAILPPNGEARIRVELEPYPLANEPTLQPRPTATPNEIASTQRTPTPIPTAFAGRVNDLYQFTNVQLDALNIDRFLVKADEANCIGGFDAVCVRLIQPGTRYIWQWFITPKDSAQGTTTTFEVKIYARREPLPESPERLVQRAEFRIGVNTTTIPLLGVGAVVLVIVGVGVGVGLWIQRRTHYEKDILFMSYRRADTREMTERLHDALTVRFGKQAVFKDIGSIDYGEDYRVRVEKSIRNCKVVLVMIGKQWLTLTDSESGQVRLFQPDDLVQAEVRWGLEGGKTIIPVLVNGASMPKEEELPPAIRELAFRNGLLIRNDPDFESDLARLLIAIDAGLEK
jgi:hypothetical protein